MITLVYPEKLLIPHEIVHIQYLSCWRKKWYTCATNTDTQLLCFPVQGLLLLASKWDVDRELSKLTVPSRGAV